MLQRQIDVSADLLALRHRIEHIVGDRGGVEVEQPNPGQALDRVEPSQQSSKRSTFTAVDAEEGGVLRDEQQLPNAALGQRFRLADDGVGGPAPILAAERWNDAEGAGVVAAFGDLHVGIVARRRQEARGRGVVEVGGEGRRSAFGARRSAVRIGPRCLHDETSKRDAVSVRPERTERCSGLSSAERRAPSAGPIASTIPSTSPVPSSASISGISFFSSSR